MQVQFCWYEGSNIRHCEVGRAVPRRNSSRGTYLPTHNIFIGECFNVFCLDLQEELADICAGLQGLLLKHLAERIQRGCEYLDWEDRLPSHLVVSGGVASNLAVREGLAGLAKHFNMEAVFPPPRLCTDNGVMIAWAGLEALKVNEIGVAPENVLGVEVCVTQMFKYFLFFSSG